MKPECSNETTFVIAFVISENLIHIFFSSKTLLAWLDHMAQQSGTHPNATVGSGRAMATV